MDNEHYKAIASRMGKADKQDEIDRLRECLRIREEISGDLRERCEHLTAENERLREYYEASEAAWDDVIDVWARGPEGYALHERVVKAREAIAAQENNDA